MVHNGILMETIEISVMASIVTKMAPSMAAVLRGPTKLCHFLYVLLIILLFFVLDFYTLIAYDRHTLLEIGSSVAHRKPDFEILNAAVCLQTPQQSPLSGPDDRDEGNVQFHIIQGIDTANNQIQH